MARKDDNSAKAAVDARTKAKDEQVAEYYEREANIKPTPTQAENDAAKVGALDVDEKEDDGSEWDDEHQRRVMEGRLPGGSPYDTRALEAGEAGESGGGGSRRGRPRKAE